MPPRDWDAAEHTCTSKRQTLPHHARLLSLHLMKQRKFKINQETDFRQKSLTLFFSPEESSHCGFQCALQMIRKGMILSANNTGETLHGWKVPLFTCMMRMAFWKKQLLCLRSFSCRSPGPLQVAIESLLAGRTKWTSCPPQQLDTQYLNFDIEKGSAYQTSELQESYLSQNPTCFLKCVLQQWTSGKEYSRRTAGHCQHSRKFKSKNVASLCKWSWFQKAVLEFSCPSISHVSEMTWCDFWVFILREQQH